MSAKQEHATQQPAPAYTRMQKLAPMAVLMEFAVGRGRQVSPGPAAAAVVHAEGQQAVP